MKWLRDFFYPIIHIVHLVVCFKADPLPSCCKVISKISSVEKSQVQQPLLPGITNDLAIACLIRIPRIEHRKLHLVCKGWHNLLSTSFFYSKRKSLGFAEEWLYIVKSDDAGNISCNAYDPFHRLWQSLPPIPREFTKALGFSCNVLSDCHLYLFGGRDTMDSAMKDVIFYCAKTNKWHKASDMIHKRQFFLSCVIDNCLYVVGGDNDGIPTTPNAVEVYDPEKETWSFVSYMTTCMSPLMGIVYNGEWFVKGLGRLGREMLSEVFIPKAGSWSITNNGLISGVGVSSAYSNGHLYSLNESKIEVYDARTDSWNIFMDIRNHLRRYGFATLVTLRGNLCIITENNISTLDGPNCGEHADTNDSMGENISERDNFGTSFTNLWSNPHGHASESRIQSCQVLTL